MAPPEQDATHDGGVEAEHAGPGPAAPGHALPPPEQDATHDAGVKAEHAGPGPAAPGHALPPPEAHLEEGEGHQPGAPATTAEPPGPIAAPEATRSDPAPNTGGQVPEQATATARDEGEHHERPRRRRRSGNLLRRVLVLAASGLFLVTLAAVVALLLAQTMGAVHLFGHYGLAPGPSAGNHP